MILPFSAMAVNWWRVQREIVHEKINAKDYVNALADLDILIASLSNYVNGLNIEERTRWQDKISDLSHCRDHLSDGIVDNANNEQASKDNQDEHCKNILTIIRDIDGDLV